MQFFRHRRERGRPPHPDVLTPAEWRVLELVREGLPNAEIAVRLGLSVPTVKTHVSSMLSKVEAPDRYALAAWDGEPVEASRAARWRFGRLGVPFGWATAKGIGVVAGAAASVVFAVALVFGLPLVLADDGEVGMPMAVVTSTPTPAAPPVGTVGAIPGEPEVAPDGRTGIPELDDLIESLLHDDAGGIELRFRDSIATNARVPDGGPVEVVEHEPGPVEPIGFNPTEWAARLAGAERSLHAVALGHPQAGPARDVDIVLVVREPAAELRGWRFGVRGNDRIVEIWVADSPGALVPSVSGEYGQFLVLPPVEELPVPPAGHDLAARTGEVGVDALLGLIEAGDAAGLVARIEYEADGSLVMHQCFNEGRLVERVIAEARVGEVAERATSVHAVAAVPEGYVPRADHLLILVTQVAPYRWEAFGLFEREGRIVGLFGRCFEHATAMYPPRAVLLPPPTDGLGGLPDRDSGVQVIDAMLAAMRAGDAAALGALADPEQAGCVEEVTDFGSPPECEGDEAPGTLLEVIAMGSCHGWYARRFEVVEMLAGGPADWRLYSVQDIGEARDPDRAFLRGSLQAAFLAVRDDASRPPAVMAITFSERGFTAVRGGCGVDAPGALIYPGQDPMFLLAPPD